VIFGQRQQNTASNFFCGFFAPTIIKIGSLLTWVIQKIKGITFWTTV